MSVKLESPVCQLSLSPLAANVGLIGMAAPGSRSRETRRGKSNSKDRVVIVFCFLPGPFW